MKKQEEFSRGDTVAFDAFRGKHKGYFLFKDDSGQNVVTTKDRLFDDEFPIRYGTNCLLTTRMVLIEKVIDFANL